MTFHDLLMLVASDDPYVVFVRQVLVPGGLLWRFIIYPLWRLLRRAWFRFRLDGFVHLGLFLVPWLRRQIVNEVDEIAALHMAKYGIGPTVADIGYEIQPRAAYRTVRRIVKCAVDDGRLRLWSGGGREETRYVCSNTRGILLAELNRPGFSGDRFM